MQTSIIIPVWNGASVINSCLEAVYNKSGYELGEVICVDNDSSDESVLRIAEVYPQVRLIRQRINLGFAGGVNAGIDQAQGDILVLLNQDCIVQPGWLDSLLETLESSSRYGIAGCTIYNPDGTVNHTGAFIRRPDAVGEHTTDLGDEKVRTAEFVTGAAVAISRHVWETVGRFDEGFFPAYYEDSDYCYRARHKGFEIAWVPQAHVRHLFSNHSWQTNPIRHLVNGCTSRYRFICKQFTVQELGNFFEAETAAVESFQYVDHALGRFIAARKTLKNLPEILERRCLDMDDTLSINDQEQLQAGFTQILRRGLEIAKKLTELEISKSLPNKEPQEPSISTFDQWVASTQRLEILRQREEKLLADLIDNSPDQATPNGTFDRSYHHLIAKLKNWWEGRDARLITELNSIFLEHMSTLELRTTQATEIDLQRRAEERLRLLELLTDYE